MHSYRKTTLRFVCTRGETKPSKLKLQLRVGNREEGNRGVKAVYPD